MTARSRWMPIAVFLCALAPLCPWASAKEAPDPTLLWKVVTNLCVPNHKRNWGAFPCQAVDTEKGIAILKAPGDKAHFLLVPTAPIAGIESPALLKPDVPNYWDYAWDFRTTLAKYAGRPVEWNDLGLAVNSVAGRSQNQLHIHIACVRTAVRDALEKHQTAIGKTWSKLDFPFNGHRYMAMRIEGNKMGSLDPFKLLAEGLPSARSAMDKQTLAVTGASFEDGQHGFFILADRADLKKGNYAASEELLDPECSRPD